MLPTPAKFHYIFNLRDLSRIWEGILHVASPECQSQKDVIALWTNECTRVIADRFTNEQDCLWFQKVIERKMIRLILFLCADSHAPCTRIGHSHFKLGNRLKRLRFSEGLYQRMLDLVTTYKS